MLSFDRDLMEELYADSPLLSSWMQQCMQTEQASSLFFPLQNYPIYGDALIENGVFADVLLSLYAGGTVAEGAARASDEINYFVQMYGREDYLQ